MTRIIHLVAPVVALGAVCRYVTSAVVLAESAQKVGPIWRARGAFDLPPLMFTEDEIEALVLGARVVTGWGDPALARAAEDVLAKVEAVLPAKLKSRVADATLFALNLRDQKDVSAKLGSFRAAIRESRKIKLEYIDRTAQPTTRTVWPLGRFYWGLTWTVGGWCELRDGFRNFRLDRIAGARVTDVRFEQMPGRTLRDLFDYYRREVASAEPRGGTQEDPG